MIALGSLGKHMNEAVEHHHKESWIRVGHTFKGGAPGNPFAVKLEDGHFLKTEGQQYEHEKQSVTLAVMQAQNRLFFDEFSSTWDDEVWETCGMQKPTADQPLRGTAGAASYPIELREARQNVRRQSNRLEGEEANLAKLKNQNSENNGGLILLSESRIANYTRAVERAEEKEKKLQQLISEPASP